MRGFMTEYYNWTSHGEEGVSEYFEAAAVPLVSEEPGPAAHVEANNHPHWVDEQHMDLAQTMVFYAVGPSYFSSSHDGVPDDDTRYKLTRGQDPRRKKSPYAVLRYLPLIPHLQRLYSSRATTEHMTWHATHQTEEGSMCHPSDAEAWKQFDQMYHDYAEEPRNVWLGLCTDGFAPQGQYGRTIDIGPLSLHRTIFPMRLIDVYLESLIEELLQLWHVGVRTTIGRRATLNATDFLPEHHPYRRNKKSITKNRVENKVARPRLSGDQLLDWFADISPAVEMPLSLPEGYGSDHK
ncbi:UNVERIFIED_CONTAM: hypothetical protein Slati_1471200 [Sesamum latifolium]|uniref:Uncharacterized protein n=1 Tax=Sesamum latifolium TaxID=2727402 RepID=A0AAW2X5N5_9LAMI